MLMQYTCKEARILGDNGNIYFDALIDDTYVGFNLGQEGVNAIMRLRDKGVEPTPATEPQKKLKHTDWESDERTSWKVTKSIDLNNSPTFLQWGGSNHHIPTLVEAGWVIKVQYNLYMGSYRLICHMPECISGVLYSERFTNPKQMEVKIKTFVPNKFIHTTRERIQETVLGIDLNDISTLELLEVLEQRMKSETPRHKKKATNENVISIIERLSA
jgi:hypothetical protein